MTSSAASIAVTAKHPVGRSEFTVAPAQARDAAAWDQFVERHAEGRFCHLWGYKRVLEEVYGYRCVYLNIFRDGRRVGIFPSIAVRRGKGRLISQPFQEYGGPLLEGVSAREQKSIGSLLVRVAQQEQCSSIEIRGGIGSEGMAGTDWCVRHPLHSYAVLRLGAEAELWRDALTNEARKGVNRARKAGLSAGVRRGPAAIEQPFYDLYLASMKRLGVPPHPPQFFTKLAEGFGDHLVASWVGKHDDPTAILLGTVAGLRVHIYVTASDPRAWSMRPNDLAHWELIRWAASTGLQVFDFGSARYPGQIQFKKKWGATLFDYSCYLLSPAGVTGSPPVQLTETSSRSLVAMSHLWKWVMPDRLSSVLGRPIRRYLTK